MQLTQWSSLLAAATVHRCELIQSHSLYQDFQMCKALKELRGLWEEEKETVEEERRAPFCVGRQDTYHVEKADLLWGKSSDGK